MLSITAMCAGAACGAVLLGRFGLATALGVAAVAIAGLASLLCLSLRDPLGRETFVDPDQNPRVPELEGRKPTLDK